LLALPLAALLVCQRGSRADAAKRDTLKREINALLAEIVYEFKPDTDAAKRNGRRQLDRYVPAVTRFYMDRIAAKTGDDSSAQGSITTLVERSCVKGGSVRFDAEVIPYPLCEKKFECTR
jgi:hypothetical protein